MWYHFTELISRADILASKPMLPSLFFQVRTVRCFLLHFRFLLPYVPTPLHVMYGFGRRITFRLRRRMRDRVLRIPGPQVSAALSSC